MASMLTTKTQDGSLRYTVLWRDRSRRQRQRTFRTKEQAQQHLGLVADPDLVSPGDPNRGKVPFRDVAERWLEYAEVRESTRARYRQLLDHHVNPTFGDLPIATITAEDVEHWIAGMKRKRPGPKQKQLRPATIVRAFSVLRSALKYARRHKYVTTLATDDIDLPTAATMGTSEFEGRNLSVAEVDAICAALHKDTYAVLLVRFLAYTGLRAGEVAGLNMADVDLLHRTITVRRTWSNGRLSEPKSSTSRRTVPMDPELVPMLRKYVEDHPDSGNPASPFFLSRVGSGMYTTDLIWPGRERKFAHGSEPQKPRPLQAGKRWDASGFYKTSFRAACRMAVPPGSDPEEFPPRGIGHVRLHDLRHTFASEQLRSGASLFEVQRLMGHADINLVARTYGHLSQHSAEQAIARAAAHREAARSATA